MGDDLPAGNGDPLAGVLEGILAAKRLEKISEVLRAVSCHRGDGAGDILKRFGDRLRRGAGRPCRARSRSARASEAAAGRHRPPALRARRRQAAGMHTPPRPPRPPHKRRRQARPHQRAASRETAAARLGGGAQGSGCGRSPAAARTRKGPCRPDEAREKTAACENAPPEAPLQGRAGRRRPAHAAHAARRFGGRRPPMARSAGSRACDRPSAGAQRPSRAGTGRPRSAASPAPRNARVRRGPQA